VSQIGVSLPSDLQDSVQAAVSDWQDGRKVERLWKRDASLWSGTDEANWLGWLTITEEQIAKVSELKQAAAKINEDKFSHLLLLGMGGSSLCPEVLGKTFGTLPGHPRLSVLDSTDPAQIRACEQQVDLAKTLFIVSSKSGTTLEPNIYKQYFFERVKQTIGAEKAGSRFLAITDPGSKMQLVAERDNFRHIFYGVSSIGGRYSALSNFGMAPAAVLGIDVDKFLKRAQEMVVACGASVPVKDNPGVLLGIILGAAANSGRDKITFITSPGIYDLGAWLEQLIAESTGKQGKGIIPVDREEAAAPEFYGKDRIFAYLRLESDADTKQAAKVGALEKAGHPVVRISLSDVYDLGREFFRWEMATAVAGSMLGINAFNQPDVEASKIATRNLTSEYEQKGSLPAESPFFEASGVKLFTDAKNADALSKAAGNNKSFARYLRAHLDRLQAGDYFGLLAYIEMNDDHEARLQDIRHAVRDTKHKATCLGFGPRFLHSTGQAYKGGPNSGVFLQVTCDDANDLPVPQQKYSFATVKAAQARGDFQVLVERNRRALRVHLGKDLAAGLSELQAAVLEALQ
jgi:transaldolase / glucose-6-phosphate isomerase